MHLAVKSADELKSTRPVRVLLYRGAPRDSKDNKGQKPSDLAKQINSITLRDELVRYLDCESGGPCESLMLNGTPMKKMNKSCKLPFTFILSHVVIYGLLSVFCFQIWEDQENINLIYSNLIIESIAVIAYLVATCKNPGFIEKPKDVDFMQLMCLVDPIQLCPDCEIVRTPRSRHCGICNRCVERYDHHCPWLNTCIGVNNHGYFLIFILLLFTSLVQVFVSTLVNFYKTYESELSFEFTGLEDIRHDKYIIQIVQISILGYTGFFVLPIAMLLYLQCINFCRNRTTNERYTNKVYGSRGSSYSQSQYSTTTSILAEELIQDLGTPRDNSDKCCVGMRNFRDMLCVNTAPS